MLDQSFSAKNFRGIFDLENRKGNFLETDFFQTVKAKSKSIQSCRSDLRSLRKEKHSNPTDDHDTRVQEALSTLRELKEEREQLLTKELENASLEITSKSFSFNIRQVKYGKSKAAFDANQTASSFFCLKQIQFNIRRLYRVKQANRHQIVCQLREILGDEFPKYIIRTDISSFYENIPRKKLLRKLETDQLLSVASKRLIRRLLIEYGRLTETDIGLPRGIGVSAYLAELYMRRFDRSVRSYPGVLYYARYVDDIVVVFCPPPNQGTIGLRKTVGKALRSLGLKRNRDKTDILDLRSGSNGIVEYLGYTFKVEPNEVILTMTSNKISRYKKRIDLTFGAYRKASKRSEKKARRWLEKRIRFLTGNTRLVNNKKNVVSGVYFSNSLLTDLSDLKELDNFLHTRISGLQSKRLKDRLSNYSFIRGFEERRYYQFSAHELSVVVGAWKDAS